MKVVIIAIVDAENDDQLDDHLFSRFQFVAAVGRRLINRDYYFTRLRVSEPKYLQPLQFRFVLTVDHPLIEHGKTIAEAREEIRQIIKAVETTEAVTIQNLVIDHRAWYDDLLDDEKRKVDVLPASTREYPVIVP
jgi:hypothetical protein